MRRPMEETVEVLGTAKETPPRAPAWGPVGASLDLGAHTALGPCCYRSHSETIRGEKTGRLLQDRKANCNFPCLCRQTVILRLYILASTR